MYGSKRAYIIEESTKATAKIEAHSLNKPPTIMVSVVEVVEVSFQRTNRFEEQILTKINVTRFF